MVRESETLSEKDIYNERIMLGLRTRKGIRLDETRTLRSGNDVVMKMNRDSSLLRLTEDGRLVATQEGLHVLNRIIEELMI